MTYLHLALAIVFEAGWAISMKASPRLDLSWPTARTLALYLASLVFLTLAVRKMDVGLAYAVWAGSGAVLIAIAGFTHFKEPLTAGRVVFMGLIFVGVVGLLITERHASTA